MRGRFLLPLLALSACAAPSSRDTSTDRDELSRALAGFVKGPTEDCLPATLETASPRIVDDRHILYSRTRDTIWVNTLESRCPGLRPTSVLVREQFGSRVCRLDRIRAYDPGLGSIPGPICAVGPFTRYDRR